MANSLEGASLEVAIQKTLKTYTSEDRKILDEAIFNAFVRPQLKMTADQLLKGHEGLVLQAARMRAEGSSAADVAEKLIKPVLSDLERNAGQEMDPTYIAYMLEWLVIKLKP